jgi:hypothetical protein
MRKICQATATVILVQCGAGMTRPSINLGLVYEYSIHPVDEDCLARLSAKLWEKGVRGGLSSAQRVPRLPDKGLNMYHAGACCQEVVVAHCMKPMCVIGPV